MGLVVTCNVLNVDLKIKNCLLRNEINGPLIGLKNTKKRVANVLKSLAQNTLCKILLKYIAIFTNANRP